MGQKAKAAFDTQRIRTYVVLRDSNVPPGDQQGGAAFNIATSGGGQSFNSRPNEEEALNAITSVVARLGSCLYAAPPGLVTSATLSYYDPIKQLDVRIPNTAASCDENTPSNAPGGWKIDGQRVRICGQACTNLRDTLQNLSKFNLAVLGQASQAVHIHPVVCTGP
jgi:hypothetical protein